MIEFLQQYWSHLTIPLVSGIVGYLTNWLAVRMMMSPLDFVGFGPVGWQGVIPANAGKLARTTVDHSVKRVLTQEELLDRIDPEQLVKAVSHRLDPFIEEIVDEVMRHASTSRLQMGGYLWSATPIGVKRRIYARVKQRLPKMLFRMVEDLKPHLDDLVDMNEIIVEKLTNDKKMLISVFRNAGDQEFKFLQRSGFYFGLPLGLPVMVIWYFYQAWWLLPLFGGLVGYLTNLIAVYLVQKPLQPKKVGFYIFQGLFIKRQKEVSRYYGKVFATDLLTAEAIIGELLRAKESLDRLRELVHREVNMALEESQGSLKTLTVVSIGPKEYDRIAHIVCDRAFDELTRPDKRSFAYIDEAMDIENTVAERVGNLPPEEFYELLHPIIAEDEWKLIAVGAVLGVSAGWWQWALMT